MKYFNLFLITVFLFFPTTSNAKEKTVQIMDIKSGAIIQELQSSDSLQTEVKKKIKSIKNLTIEANPVPKTGYLIRVPFTQPLKIKNQWYNEIAYETIIIYSTDPNLSNKIVLFTDENKPIFFDLEGNLHTLFEMLKLKKK